MPPRDDREPQTHEETFATLSELARRRTGRIAPDAIAAHVIAVTQGTDWSVRRAALEALLRRFRFIERDGLVVTARPKGGVIGVYATGRAEAGRRRKRAARPWATELESLEPLRGSCGCPDFLRGSLGLCKHLLCVIDSVLAKKGALDAARRAAPLAGDLPRLVWNPVRALSGDGDRLVGLALAGGPAPRVIARWLGGPVDGVRRFAPAAFGDVARRAALLADVERALARGLSAQPSAAAVVVEERERAARRLAGSRAAARLFEHTRGLKRELYPYQREGVRRFLEAERLLLADDMGLGKTTQAIAVCHALFRGKRVARGLLVVPSALKPQWVREWEATTDAPIVAIDGSPDERAQQYCSLRAGFAVIGYEQLLRDFDQIVSLAPEMVVLDEAQRIKNFATKSAAYVKALTPRYRLVLTGTPMENRLDELASVLDWVDDTALAPKWRLAPWHTTLDGGGARNLDTLRARLAPCVVRRVRKDVLSQLPSRTDTRVPVAMTEQQRVEHDDMRQPIASLMQRAAKRPLTQAEFLKLMSLLTTQRIISNGLGQLRFDEIWPAYSGARPDAALLEGLFAPKLLELRRLVEEVAIRQGRKIVIFSQWLRMLRLAHWSLGDLLGDHRLRAVFFTGNESAKRRTQSIVDFHDEPDVRLMFLSDAGGVGLNLQRAASACINLELPWNPAVLEQRIGRIYRLGQTRPIDVFHLVTEYGIEARIAALVASKKALFSGLFDGTTDEIRFDGKRSFLADVEKLVATAPDVPRESEPAAGADDSDADAEASPIESAPEPRVARSPGESSARVVESSTAVRELFAQLSVRRAASGAVSIEAPPEAAASLVALFEGMARMIAGDGDAPGSGKRAGVA